MQRRSWPGTFHACGCDFFRPGTSCACGDGIAVPDGVECPRPQEKVPDGEDWRREGRAGDAYWAGQSDTTSRSSPTEHPRASQMAESVE